MSKNIAQFGSVIFIVGLLTACAGSPFYHKTFMRGQVVGIEENDVFLCIGSEDGAQVGQTLDVYRVSNQTATQESDYEYKREYISKVAIYAIVNDHFARASVNSGDVKLHDVVELEK